MDKKKLKLVVSAVTFAVLLNVVMIGSKLYSIYYVGESSAPTASSSTTSIAPQTPTRGGCQAAAGNIWSGVTLYSDSGCNNAVGSIVGATSDAQTIKVSAGGSETWQSRRDIKGFYVKGDDPAISRMSLITFTQ